MRQLTDIVEHEVRAPQGTVTVTPSMQGRGAQIGSTVLICPCRVCFRDEQSRGQMAFRLLESQVSRLLAW